MLSYETILNGESIDDMSEKYGTIFMEHENDMNTTCVARVHEVYDFLSLSGRICWFKVIDKVFGNEDETSHVVCLDKCPCCRANTITF